MTKKNSHFLETSPWAPFKHSIFRMLWIASTVSNIGSAMQDVGTAWLMTSLTHNPFLVALIQAATSFPLFLLALPAGALADIIDRRHHLIMLQTFMMLIALSLAIGAYFHLLTPLLLLLFTFGLGICNALTSPTWQATVPELVPPTALAGAINLNSAGMNISRAVGPAIAGVIIAMGGTTTVFAFNALSFLAIIAVLIHWRRAPKESTLPAERFFSAMRTGIRYVNASPTLHHVMLLAAVFIFFASAIWALLPLVARIGLNYGASGYGVLLGLLGSGAVISAILLPRLNIYFQRDKFIQCGFVLFGIASLILACIKIFYLACLAMLLAGIGWLMVLATLMTIIQHMVPSWVRGRAISICFMAIYGSMAFGSMFWGILSTHFGIHFSLLIAAAGLFLGSFIAYFYSINIPDLDHSQSKNLPSLAHPAEVDPEHGPVMITIEYIIEKENKSAFLKVMRELRQIRLREGAFFWKLFNDTEHATHFVECFMSESWIEHLRFHERISVSDLKVQSQAKAFHTGQNSPRITHLVGCDLSKKSRNA